MDFRFLGCARNDMVGAQKDVPGAQRDVVEAQEDTDWGGDDGQGGLLAAGEAGIFRSPLISSRLGELEEWITGLERFLVTTCQGPQWLV